MGKIQSPRDLEIYGKAFDAAMQVFELSKSFPREEIYSLTADQAVLAFSRCKPGRGLAETAVSGCVRKQADGL
jgi:hypothetical protein